MTGGDDRFEVRLGRMRSPSGARKVEGFFRKVSKCAGRIGRGRGHGRSQRNAARTQFHRRVLVKVRVVRMDAKGVVAQRLHFDYVERDGTSPDGAPSRLYDRHGPDAHKQAFLERGAEDRHQFRIILSPEDAGELQSLTEFTRDLTAQMERDLGTRLDWVAVDHYDTGQPHTHLIISGKRDDGSDLVIPRQYIAHGLRERAQDLVELELGPVLERQGRERMARMVVQERFTEIDCALFRRAREGFVDLSEPTRRGHEWRRQIERMRLNQLERMSLAEPLGKGRWRLSTQAEDVLRQMGERGDIIKTMHRAMKDNDVSRTLDAASLFDPSSPTAKPVTGVILDKGVADDVSDRAYVIVDSLEGRPVYIAIGGEDRLPNLAKGRIVTFSPPNKEPRRSDHLIAEIAGKNDGRYSSALHLQRDKSARPEFIAAHMRRLEALRRAGHVERDPDGTWRVPSDYIERARSYERAAALGRPVGVTVHSTLRLSQMKTAMGATWLDEHLRDFEDGDAVHGFAGEVETARAARRQFLLRQGFMDRAQGRLTQAVLDRLEAHDLQGAGDQLAETLAKPYAPAPAAGRVQGIYAQAIERPSGKYAVIERARDFTLVPWREVMDRNLGKSVSGLIRDGGISWTLTRGRGIG